ncbi:MAG: hypothetical protein L0219_06010 [Phycisphaerales bacterium]|nr:hypothetical protein [Phycisphaerales bacterium]
MNITIATMPKDEAIEKFREYQSAVKRSRGAADRLMARAYKALAEGYGILNLKEALTTAGVNTETWLPKLAAMRADQPLVYFQRGWEGEGFYSYTRGRYLNRRNKGAQAQRLQFHAPPGTLPEAPWDKQPRNYRWLHLAPVPPIPPQFRPADALSKYVILWEVSKWDPVLPPEDPILLKPISRELYAVLAHWALTPIEQIVLKSILGQ